MPDEPFISQTVQTPIGVGYVLTTGEWIQVYVMPKDRLYTGVRWWTCRREDLEPA